MLREGSEARPHQDMAHWDVPESGPAQTLLTQIAANVCLGAGVALELWSWGFKTRPPVRG